MSEELYLWFSVKNKRFGFFAGSNVFMALQFINEFRLLAQTMNLA